MPTFDFTCDAADCSSRGAKFESYLRRHDSPSPSCPACGGTLRKLLAAPHGIFLKPWGAYGSPKLEGYDPNHGITAYRTRSSRHLDGTPEKVYLESYSDVKTYCRDEGLRDPGDFNSGAELDRDGKTLRTSGRGSQWV